MQQTRETFLQSLKTPKTIMDAVRKQKKPLMDASGSLQDINLSSIATRIIQDSGRFAERYASDMLISWDSLMRDLKSLHEEYRHGLTEPVEFCRVFAIRRDGVDHNGYFMSRLKETRDLGAFALPYVHADRTYRRVLAVRVRTDEMESWMSNPPSVTVSLHDITNDIRAIDPEDEKEESA